jgi:hypothetical protein
MGSTQDTPEWGLGHLGVNTDPDSLGIRITNIPLTDQERRSALRGLNFLALLVETGPAGLFDDEDAAALRQLAELFRDGEFEPFDSPLAARFLQVRRERDEAVRMLFEAHELLAGLADRVEALTGVEVDA